MKKFIFALLISLSLSLSFNASAIGFQVPSKTLTEGVYNANDLDIPLNDINYAQNISDKGITYFIIYDEGNTIVQSIKLMPNSPKVQLYPKLDSSYKLIVVGDGSIALS
ncbi:hypothetical protein [Clostridium sp.]|uniref:hypothetical protein n=1 Tax=Clostridium sp. TaxID=1506 RepID=UPI0025BE1BEA|nr:hypothetical protein [Clostridium sp.]